MAKQLNCSDLGQVDCTWIGTADTEEELLAQAGAHAAEAHGMTEITPDILAEVKSAIKDV